MEKLLTQVCKIQYGYPFDSNKFAPSNGMPVIRIRDVVRGYSETYTTEEYDSSYIVNDGDMLVGMDGEFNIGKWNGGTALLNQRVCRLFPTEELDADYLFYFMPKVLKEIEAATPFATVKHLSAKQLNKIVIPLPGIEEQRTIARKFVLLDSLIKSRTEQLCNLDNLVKSRFIELFGDPFDNKKWTTQKLRNISVSISDGSNVDKAHYKERGDVLFLRIQNVWFNEFRLDDSVYISQDVNDEYLDTSLHFGDLLITKIGRYYTKDSSLGRVSVYLGENDKANYSNNIMRVRLTDEVCSEFVNVLMNLDDYNRYIREVSVGGTDKRALSKAIIGDLPIIMPPKELQIKFLEFVRQTDKLKLAVTEALAELETLKKSLMQQYFG